MAVEISSFHILPLAAVAAGRHRTLRIPMHTDLGIRVDGLSWVIYAGFLLTWVASLWVAPFWSRLRWQALPMSFFGYVWVGFGINYAIRFPLLCWDSFFLGNMTSRLADATSEQVTTALLLTWLFYSTFIVAYVLGLRLFSVFLGRRISLIGEHSRETQIVVALVALVGIVASSGRVPMQDALVTPLGILGRLWILPAGFAWVEWFSSRGRQSSGWRWVFLLPGLLQATLSPYRENLLTGALVVLIAALFAGRRFRPVRATAVIAVLFFFGTITISAYRQFYWENKPAQEALGYAFSGYRFEKAFDTKWAEVARRFHGFDSLLLTVRHVPEFLPHSGREVIFSAFVRGVVPRALLPDKERSDRGQQFGQSIWSYEDVSKDSGAPITPSIIGDLFESRGAWMVPLGAIVLGLVIGVLEGWRTRLSWKGAASLTALFAFHFFGASERDFAHMIATTVQLLLVIYLLSLVLGAAGAAPGQRPKAEGTDPHVSRPARSLLAPARFPGSRFEAAASDAIGVLLQGPGGSTGISLSDPAI